MIEPLFIPPPALDRSFWIGIRNAALFGLAFFAALYFGIRPLFWAVQEIGRAL